MKVSCVVQQVKDPVFLYLHQSLAWELPQVWVWQKKKKKQPKGRESSDENSKSCLTTRPSHI